jgi:hypothetical protein
MTWRELIGKFIVSDMSLDDKVSVRVVYRSPDNINGIVDYSKTFVSDSPHCVDIRFGKLSIEGSLLESENLKKK